MRKTGSGEKYEIYELMNKFSIQHVPIIDKGRRINELFIHNSLISEEKVSHNNTVVIMAEEEKEKD